MTDDAYRDCLSRWAEGACLWLQAELRYADDPEIEAWVEEALDWIDRRLFQYRYAVPVRRPDGTIKLVKVEV